MLKWRRFPLLSTLGMGKVHPMYFPSLYVKPAGLVKVKLMMHSPILRLSFKWRGSLKLGLTINEKRFPMRSASSGVRVPYGE